MEAGERRVVVRGRHRWSAKWRAVGWGSWVILSVGFILWCVLDTWHDLVGASVVFRGLPILLLMPLAFAYRTDWMVQIHGRELSVRRMDVLLFARFRGTRQTLEVSDLPLTMSIRQGRFFVVSSMGEDVSFHFALDDAVSLIDAVNTLVNRGDMDRFSRGA